MLCVPPLRNQHANPPLLRYPWRHDWHYHHGNFTKQPIQGGRVNALDEEAEKYYPNRVLIKYYKKLISGLDKRIAEYKDKIEKLEKE